MKLRMNVLIVDPMQKQQKLHERLKKKQQQTQLADEKKRLKKQNLKLS